MSLLSVRSLVVDYQTSSGVVHAVNDVSLEIEAGETVGLVGESGCGKSTLGKAIMQLIPATNGQIVLDGQNISSLSPSAMRPIRAKMQMIFQDPYNSLNPRRTVGNLIAQPLQVAGYDKAAIAARVSELMTQVGLPPDAASRYPHEFSGGQRQRIGIARALALKPKLVICDEPVSALDVSIRAQVINLLQDLSDKLGVSYLFISHDLTMVQHIANKLIVMYLGRVVETGSAETIWKHPAHPYTQALLAAAPVADPHVMRSRNRFVLQGDLPSPTNLPQGCAFSTRCPFVTDRCRQERPVLRPLGENRRTACHYDLVDQLEGAASTSISSFSRNVEGKYKVGARA
ncbi:peptide/nickel transport system ATP-binding protein [Rhodopseudomonas thermotolerans]|uniref:Peptide/nickel transport system ATP-binding protein n=2 Tax=Rhodopseudomonas TaxID=1073 RepID=A0A336JXW8_9BRAD|nr:MULTISPECIES: oligopeptide/dipeptide ABC transporter ATP-binding protein [Rhodopseudomonas]RED24462.1 peptide/nickel transport system ATP-binding protein [Rhodopseudomonas pentothenatexigens]REF90347.1 peptide/nickel transport system ATP-binding protein [Rhodopseudomonas thermotolerans]SSW93206.1 peptide/nickel transport system ATP-binding protein [Rhodopseudomonas pentothenatexigens]